MKHGDVARIMAIVVFACFLLCTPALASYNFDGWPVETRASGTINGGIFIDYEPWDGSTDLTLTTTVPSGTVERAYLYTGVWGGKEIYNGWVNVIFNGVADSNGLGPIHLQGVNDTNPQVWCTTHGKYWMSYDVTDLVNAGSVNTARTAKINATYGAFDGRVYGIVLVVVYEGGDNPKDIQYWINDGNDALHYAEATWPPLAHDTGTTYFNGTVNTDVVSNADLTMVHLTAYEPACSNCLQINGNSLDTSMVNSNTFELNSWNVLEYINVAENNAWYSRGEDSYINVPLAILTLEETSTRSDLIVESITPNCGYIFGNESNEFCAKITNNGTGVAGAFDVSFAAGTFNEQVRVADGLAAGANTTVCVIDPTTRTAGEAVTITVIADCNGEVTESNETNNTTVQAETVVNNGYKGKRYTGGEDLITWKTFELQGDLRYSVGDSYYLSASSYPHWTQYVVNWSASDLQVPGTGTVKEARLYVPYTWDKTGVMADDVSLTFNGNAQPLDAHYSDRKLYGSSDYPYGMLTYDVTANFNANENNAVLTNAYDGGGNVSIRGMVLVVIYEDSSEPQRMVIMNEGFDLLYGGPSMCTTAEEATAYAPFGTIDLTHYGEGKLITIAPGAGPTEGELLFNGQTWTNVWDYTASSQIGIDERDVSSYLQATDNVAGFQSSGDYMEASNAILVLKYAAASVTPTPTPTPTPRRGGGGGGGGTSLDSDGDGYFDTVEIMIGTDPNDPNDYPGKPAATSTPTPIERTTIVGTITTPPPTVTPTVPAPEATSTPEPATTTAEEPGFEAVFAVAGLLTIAYVVLRMKRK